jgi:uncharacterized protein
MEQEAGDLESDAFEQIGDMYELGADLPKSHSDAVSWYRKGAEKGNAKIQVKLATVLLNQKGPIDYSEVRSLCQEAFNHNSSSGAYCLGMLYQKGLGLPRDSAQAAKWFTKAADMGHSRAMLQLGEMHLKGEGVKQDNVAAYEYIHIAASLGLLEANEENDRLGHELSAKDLKKAQVKISEWVRTHHPLVLFDNTPKIQ